MATRNWYPEGDGRPSGVFPRGINYDTTSYREIVDLKNIEGTDEAVLSGLVLSDIVDAAESWHAAHPEEPYADTVILLTDEETDIVADAESHWSSIPGNRERQESRWHAEYQQRIGVALTTLAGAGYEASGVASRHDWFFRMSATHPELQGESAIDTVFEALNYNGTRYGFKIDIDESGILVINYASCPPGSNFEPVVKNLANIFQA